MPLPLSVVLVCKNSEPTIGRLLESVAGLGQEIVALDTGSTDGTVALLERAGARVVHTEWRGYVAARQMALGAARLSWALLLDSDESLTAELRASIERAVRRDDPGVSGYEMNRKVWYRERPLNFAWQPELRLRLVRVGHAACTGVEPHDRVELIQPSAGPRRRIARLTGDLRHDALRTFSEFLAKQCAYARTMALSMHAAGRRGSAWKLLTSPSGAFLKQILIKQAWRDGRPGWLAAGTIAASTLMKHICLLELDCDPMARSDVEGRSNATDRTPGLS